MAPVIPLLVALLLLEPLSAVPDSQPARQPLVDNEFLAVWKNEAPCGTVPARCDGSVLLALSPVRLGDGAMQRGAFQAFAAGTHYAAPAGGDFLAIELKKGRPAGPRPAEARPAPSIAPLQDDPTFFVYIEALAPGETRARHSHGARLLVVLDGAEVAMLDASGAAGPVVKMASDQVTFSPPTVHETKNVGTTSLRNWALEIK